MQPEKKQLTFDFSLDYRKAIRNLLISFNWKLIYQLEKMVYQFDQLVDQLVAGQTERIFQQGLKTNVINASLESKINA